MPTKIKQLMTINPPTSPTEWLMVAKSLMKTQAPKPEQNTFRQNVPIRPRQNTFVPQNRYSFRPNFQNFNRIRPQHLPNQHAHKFNNRGFRPNHHTHFQHGLPPYPLSTSSSSCASASSSNARVLDEKGQAHPGIHKRRIWKIGSCVGRNQTTVMRICDRWMQEGTTDPRGPSHPPQCTTSLEDRQILRMAVMDRSVTS
ncbi:uncharacterized protein TNCV_1858071 [Trichonephila clavipes]|nr:uncharacterized protein TNCV_1858071 [Trichonephila clavipes]